MTRFRVLFALLLLVVLLEGVAVVSYQLSGLEYALLGVLPLLLVPALALDGRGSKRPTVL